MSDKTIVPIAVETPAAVPEKKGGKKRGKASKQKSSDKFRQAMNEKQYKARRAEVDKHFLNDEEFAAIEESLKSMKLTVQPRAIPLTVATRGVGFASSIEYSRMATTWNLDAIEEICTIHQFYRVNLHLLEYQLSQSYLNQGETLSYPLDGVVLFGEKTRQLVQPLTQIPIATANVLHCVGKVEANTIFHARPYDGVPETGDQMALYLRPGLVSAAVEYMANGQNPAEQRNLFYALNPIPGSRWVEQGPDGWILQNPDEIWPADYNVEGLSSDIHAYQNLLTRVGNRLPRSFLTTHSWNGKGSRALTASMDPVPMRLSARFRTNKKVLAIC